MVTRMRSTGVVTAVAALLLSGCTTTKAGPTDVDSGTIRLVAFDSCADTLAALRKAAAANVSRWEHGFRDDLARGGPMPPVPDARAAAPGEATADADASSKTNNHEAGVDEADLVKTDGKRIVTVIDGTLRVADAESRRLSGSLDLAGALGGKNGQPPALYASQLLLHGSRALVVTTGGYGVPLPASDVAKPTVPGGPSAERSRLLLVELDGGPRLLGSLSVDGAYLDARQIGSVARLVVRSSPRLPYRYPDGVKAPQQIERENRGVLAESTPEQWLPGFELAAGGREERGRVGCERVVRPQTFTGESMLTLYTLDLSKALTDGDPLTVLADGQTVYATGSHLYVAHDAYSSQVIRGRESGAVERTEIHQFDISRAGTPRYTASGVVQGALLNQYAMSEHDGHLRIATTSSRSDATCCDQAATDSTVYVLGTRGRSLVEVGRVGGLGKGERIHAVRFAGPVGYVVTFRQTDPVYTLDLRDPKQPRVTGELKINGYSAYLHPVDDRTLIGVGQEATAEGRRLGTQVSVFDVGDASRPRRVAQYVIRDSSSEVEFDPHAFLYWPKRKVLVVPVTVHGVVAPRLAPSFAPPSAGAVVLELGDGKITERGVVRHPVAPGGVESGIRRSLVVGETLWTVSASGLSAESLETLTRQAWLPFQ